MNKLSMMQKVIELLEESDELLGKMEMDEEQNGTNPYPYFAIRVNVGDGIEKARLNEEILSESGDYDEEEA